MDPCVNKIMNDIYFSKQVPEMYLRGSASKNLTNSLSTETESGETNPTNLVSSNLANPSAIEEPSQRSAEAKDTNTECESEVDGQVSVL